MREAVHLGTNVFVPFDVDAYLARLYGPSFLRPYDRAGGDSAIEPVGSLLRCMEPFSNVGGLGPPRTSST